MLLLINHVILFLFKLKPTNLTKATPIFVGGAKPQFMGYTVHAKYFATFSSEQLSGTDSDQGK